MGHDTSNSERSQLCVAGPRTAQYEAGIVELAAEIRSLRDGEGLEEPQAVREGPLQDSTRPLQKGPLDLQAWIWGMMLVKRSSTALYSTEPRFGLTPSW